MSNLNRLRLAAIAVACSTLCGLSATLHAQAGFRINGRDHLPAPDTANGYAVGDIDGDGDVDLVSPRGRILINDGRARFAAQNLLPALPRDTQFAIADFDGDGDADLIAATPDLRVFTQTGALQFQEQPGLSILSTRLATFAKIVVAGDMDGDGDVDIVVDQDASIPAVAFNDGSGQFVVTQQPTLLQLRWNSPRARVRLADMDGDGDLDVVSTGGTTSPPNSLTNVGQLLLNDGSGVLTPAWSIGSIDDLIPVDYDVDGSMDLISVQTGIELTQSDDQVRLHQNLFSTPTSASFATGLSGVERRWPVAATDLTGDGRPDLLFGVGYLLPNAAPGASAATRVTSADLGLFGTLQTPDLNGDGKADIVANVATLLINATASPTAGLPTFRNASLSLPLTLPERSIRAAADIDGDGDLDYIDTDRLTDEMAVLIREDDLSLRRIPIGVVSAETKLVDVDGDGDPDLVGRDTMLINDGSGNFAPVAAPPILDVGRWFRFEAADIDADGAVDLVVVAQFANTVILWNDGSGSFLTETTVPNAFSQSTSQSIHIADIDNDGDLDILAHGVLINQGGRAFSEELSSRVPASIPLFGLSWTSLFDMDGDGDVDLLWAGIFTLLNDGNGNFVDNGRMPEGVGIGIPQDFDEDGDLDYLFWQPFALRVAVNDGSGVFTMQQLSSTPSSFLSLFADADEDGDLDVILLNSITLNTTVQLSAPFLPTRGETYTVRTQFAPHRSTAARTVATLIGFAPARLPVPGIGVLGLDPAATVLWSTSTLNPGDATAEASVNIPAGLASGFEFYVQAAILDQARGLSLSNRIAERTD